MVRVLAVTVGVLLMLGACGSSSGTTTPDLVTYKVGGNAPGADITYESSSGISQQENVAVPLTHSSGATGLKVVLDPSQHPYISAQNTGGGTITCEIDLNGLEVARNTSVGSYAIAECDG